jgi:chorismate synthase
MKLTYLTAGESHGKGLIGVIEGMPANIPISEAYINEQLKRRQSGYGRGGRMKIESDTVEIFSGVRFGKTTGMPISFLIRNNDWQNWTERMAISGERGKVEKISIPRPGHADMVGVQKYLLDDIRNSIERSSARETAARVAACSFARQFLLHFGISVGSFVENIGGVYSKQLKYIDMLNKQTLPFETGAAFSDAADVSEVRVLDQEQERRIIARIKKAKKAGDTLGGTFVVIATGVPPGLGSFTQSYTRLDAQLAETMVSINAVKGVEIGAGFLSADSAGSEIHDEIVLKDGMFLRKTNRAGGVEGGISNGMPIVVRAAMKPIATLMTPLESVDLHGLKPVEARRERSDFTAVPACAVIGEAMMSWTLADNFLDKFGGDSAAEIADNFNTYKKKLLTRIQKNFK